jgi:hypothetical protein
MADGKGCKCAAHSESECGCDADWTPQEVYDLRSENERLKEAIRAPALTQAEREALEVAVEYVGSAYAVEHHARTIERLLERTR